MSRAAPLLLAAGLLLAGPSAQAATVRWTGLGPSSLWSEAANWDGLRVPANGDALLFGAPAARQESVFDLARSFASLVIAAEAPAFSLRVQGSAAVLSFDGFGLRNSGSASPQRFDADGGSIVFSGRSGINLGDATDLRPVNLSARGGGHLIFQDDAATSASTYDSLRAESGGDIRFSGRAVATRSATITIASGGQASFSELARADAIFNLLPGSGGAQVDFSGQARASAAASFYNQGATTAGAAAQAVTRFRADATLAGSVTNEAAAVAGAPGGRLELRDRAAHDTAGLDPTLGTVLIRNGGATVAGAGSGSTVFRDDSAVRGGQLAIVNAVQAEGAVPGALGGRTEFRDRAPAGSASVTNEGAATAGAGSGSTLFADEANAQQATITNHGGLTTGDMGTTRFRDLASAGQALIVSQGGRAASAFGGLSYFEGRATAGAATLAMAGGAVHRALGGFAAFYADSSAGSATLDVQAASVVGATGGRAVFAERASAGAARITVAGSAVDHVLGAEGGVVTFSNASSAGEAVFTVGGNRYAGGGVGALRFSDGSTAALATITLSAGQTRGGALSFEGQDGLAQASAGGARISNLGASSGAPRGLAIGGQTTFAADSNAGTAVLSNGAGSGAGFTLFVANSSAADAQLSNLGGAAGEDGGSTQFVNSSSAARALIVNRAGARGSSGFDAAGLTRFKDQSSAGQARITAEGARASGAIGGLVVFDGAADPARATLVAEGGSNGGGGGRLRFGGLTNSSQVRVILNAGDRPGAAGELDISALSVGGVGIGTLAGGGTVQLGSRRLVFFSAAASTFTGSLRDGGLAGGTGGSLSIAGGATLTLAGSSSFSGGTRIGDGLNAGSGKLVAANSEGSATGTGEVLVQRGGTLGGSGLIAGPVRLMDGGVIAPGDPVTLTLNGDLIWDGGGVVRLVLGSDAAGSDHLRMHRLIRGAAGPLLLDLVDVGVTAGSSYDLLQFDSAVGLAASDFSFIGRAGTLALESGRLAFTASAVPEPGSVLLWLPGLLALVVSSSWRTRRVARSLSRSAAATPAGTARP